MAKYKQEIKNRLLKDNRAMAKLMMHFNCTQQTIVKGINEDVPKWVGPNQVIMVKQVLGLPSKMEILDYE